MSDTQARQTAPTRTWIKVVLVVSLALNLLVVGAIGGAAIFGEQWKFQRMAHRLASAGGPLSLALDREDRREMVQKLREARRAQTLPGGHRAEMQQLLQDIRADPFEPEQVAQRLERLRAIFVEQMALGHGVLVDHIAGMPAERRAEYADRLEKVMRRMP